MFTFKVENKYGEVMELTHNSDYVITSIDGIDPPQAVINTTRNASADGSVYNSAYVDNRTITITLAINESAEDNRIKLYRYFKPKYPVKLYYKNEERDVYIRGFVQNMPITFFNQKQIAQITILCPDPFFVGAEEGVTEFSSVESLFEFPFNIEDNYNLLPNTMQTATIGGVVFTVNTDKTVDADGESVDYVSAYVNETGISLEAGAYVLYGCAAGGSPSTYRLQAFAGSAESPTLEINDYGAGASFELTETTTIKVRIMTKGVVDQKFKPMIFERSEITYGTASGTPAHFIDGSDNALEECETKINPVQDLHGYSKPWIGGAGKNKIDVTNPKYPSTVIDSSGNLIPSNYYDTWEFDGGVKYAFSLVKGSGFDSVRYALTVDGVTTRYATSTVPVYINATSATKMYLSMGKTDFGTDIQLEVGETVTDYEPYSNICPITGHDEVNIRTSGKNLLNFAVNQPITAGGGNLTLTPLGDGGFRLNGTTSTAGIIVWNATMPNGGSSSTANQGKKTIPNGNYKFTIFDSRLNTQVRGSNSPSGNDNAIATSAYGADFTIDDTYAYNWVRIQYTGNVSFNNEDFYPMIRRADDLDDTFVPYIPTQDVSVDLGRDVYGGTLNVKTGELVIDRELITLDGSDDEGWFKSSLTSCDIFCYINSSHTFNNDDTLLNEFEFINQSNYNQIGYAWWDSAGTQLRIGFSTYNTTNLTAFKTWLDSNPIQITGFLSTPQTYQLTKAQVRSIVGENYIESDTGEIDVNYIVYSDISRNYQKYGSAGGVEFSVIIINRETNVYNGGDVETGAVITLQIEGVVKDPKIYNVETNEYFILDDLTLQDGDLVTINTVKKQKSVTLLRGGAVTNLIGKVRFGSTWFQLFPLDNTFIATADLYPENMLVTFTISNLFEGV